MTFKVLLAQKNMKQRDIAKELGVSEPVVSNWVNQIKPVPNVYREKLKKLLKVPIRTINEVSL